MEWRMWFCQNSVALVGRLMAMVQVLWHLACSKLHTSCSPRCSGIPGPSPRTNTLSILPLPPFFIRLFMPVKVLLHIAKCEGQPPSMVLSSQRLWKIQNTLTL